LQVPGVQLVFGVELALMEMDGVLLYTVTVFVFAQLYLSLTVTL